MAGSWLYISLRISIYIDASFSHADASEAPFHALFLHREREREREREERENSK